MNEDTRWSVSTATSLAEVDAAAWDALAGCSDAGPAANPFVSHAFLLALEKAGCVSAQAGWAPAHQLVRDAAGTLIGAAPCYIKSHSMGEYVFDHAWADALERAGGQYYPKLQVAVPFTPATGPRLLGSSANPDVAPALVAGMQALRKKIGGSSIHGTFLIEQEAEALESQGFLVREDRQFHWINENFGSFEAFLATLSSRKRKMIRRERKEALAPGITIEWLTGSAITEAHWDAFFAFYMDTGARKWGRPYLNRQFFSLIGETMAKDILLVMARRNGQYIAGAINFIGKTTLFGRNWGAIEEHPFLHFEVCYYQAMDFAMAHNLAFVEAGAQGEHKLMRGYRPVITRSAHAIAHPGLRQAVASYLLRERNHIAEEKIVLDMMTPFRRT